MIHLMISSLLPSPLQSFPTPPTSRQHLFNNIFQLVVALHLLLCLLLVHLAFQCLNLKRSVLQRIRFHEQNCKVIDFLYQHIANCEAKIDCAIV